jgi:hypothetical protein
VTQPDDTLPGNTERLLPVQPDNFQPPPPIQWTFKDAESGEPLPRRALIELVAEPGPELKRPIPPRKQPRRHLMTREEWRIFFIVLIAALLGAFLGFAAGVVSDWYAVRWMP